jgi:serine/threonine protein kinase
MVPNIAVRGGDGVRSPVRPGDIVAGKYQVDEILGSGGNGVVVAAMHLELRARVAIKFVDPEALKDDVAAARLLREARATARIPSEHVAGILDVGTLESGAPYLVMELFDGVDLATLIQERGRVDIDDAVGYVLQVCEAVREAHALGIIHRDLKPSNVFLARDAAGRQSIKVLDFGLAKVIGSRSFDGRLTGPNALIGSPLYMSPEQMTDSSVVDGQTDIWSIGVLLFELLAGRPPFSASSLPQICTLVLHGKAPSLSDLGVVVPEGLEGVIQRCLRRNPSNRFSSVADLGQALAPFTSVQLGLRPEARAQRSEPRTIQSIAVTALRGAFLAAVGAAAAFAVATWWPRPGQGTPEHPPAPALPSVGIGTEIVPDTATLFVAQPVAERFVESKPPPARAPRKKETKPPSAVRRNPVLLLDDEDHVIDADHGLLGRAKAAH